MKKFDSTHMLCYGRAIGKSENPGVQVIMWWAQSAPPG